MRFPAAPLDGYAARVTTGLAYVGGLLTLPLLFAYLANLRWAALAIPVLVALPLATFLLLTYLQQPVEYLIDDDALVVRRRRWRALRVPLAEISGASLAPALADVPRRGLRLALNPGIFGYQGPFQLDQLGRGFFLATNRERLVAVGRVAAVSLIISPESPRAFVEALNERRAQSATEELVGA
jgi:hypothetical protein